MLLVWARHPDFIYVAIINIQFKNTWQCPWSCACCLKKRRRCRRFPRSFLSVQSCEESFVPSQTLDSKELSVHLKVQHLMKETSGECTEHHCVQNKPPQSQGFQAVHEPSRNNALKFQVSLKCYDHFKLYSTNHED